MEKAKVYFTKEITPEAMIKMYEILKVELSGKVAVKVHSGEVGNQNFIKPDFMEPIIKYVINAINGDIKPDINCALKPWSHTF